MLRCHSVVRAIYVVARHDFLPFGEEIGAGTELRTTGQGFGAMDKIRQRYALTERDDATGLDHTWWRKYENMAGRWTSPDPYLGSMSLADPQSFNRYAYVQNDPVNFVDPTGLDGEPPECPEGTVAMRDDAGDWQCVGVGDNPVDVPISWDDDVSELLPRLVNFDVLIVRVEPFRTPTVPTIDLDPESELEPELKTVNDKESLENCVLSALGRFLKAETVAQLKLIAAKTRGLVSVYIGRTLLGIAGAEIGARGFGFAQLTGVHTIFQVAIRIASGAYAVKLAVDSVRETYRNSRDFNIALRKCFLGSSG